MWKKYKPNKLLFIRLHESNFNLKEATKKHFFKSRIQSVTWKIQKSVWIKKYWAHSDTLAYTPYDVAKKKMFAFFFQLNAHGESLAALPSHIFFFSANIFCLVVRTQQSNSNSIKQSIVYVLNAHDLYYTLLHLLRFFSSSFSSSLCVFFVRFVCVCVNTKN